MEKKKRDRYPTVKMLRHHRDRVTKGPRTDRVLDISQKTSLFQFEQRNGVLKSISLIPFLSPKETFYNSRWLIVLLWFREAWWLSGSTPDCCPAVPGLNPASSQPTADCQSSGGLPPEMALGCGLTSMRGDKEDI